MDAPPASELKTLLIGVPLPAQKPELLAYAVQQRAEPALLEALRSLPERRYESLDEVAEELVHVQPQQTNDTPQEPREVSGPPPGDAAYTDAAKRS
jgi:hypothetical protein